MKPDQIDPKAICIILRNGRDILVTGGFDAVKNEYFGRIIGGGIEFGETSEQGIRRELQEELGTDIENLRFVKIIENIFTYNGNNGHQLIFLFKGDLADKALYEKDRFPILDKEGLDAFWLSLDDVAAGKVKLLPGV